MGIYFNQLRKIFGILGVFFLGILFFNSASYGAMFYVNGSLESDSGDGTSWSTAKKYISSGVSLMSGGDTLTIADGVYTGSLDRIASPPSGSTGAYTTIRAQTDFGVTLQGITPQSGYGAVVYMKSREYVTIRGLKVYDVQPASDTMPGAPFYSESCNHIKFIRCASDGTAPSTSTNGNVGSAFASIRTPYLLLEECFAFGPGRYPFSVGDGSTGTTQGANYAIFRRCVQRWDYSDNYEVKASFSFYAQQHCAAQNCIAIDGKDIKGPKAGSYEGIKAFFTPNGSEGDIHFDGNIVLNYEGAGYWIEDGPINTTYLNNSIAWDLKDEGDSETYGPYLVACRYDDNGGVGPFDIDSCTLGGCENGLGVEFDLHGAPITSASIKNSIVAGVTLDVDRYVVEGGPTSYNYNYYYGNTDGRNKDGGVGVNSVENVNPLTSGLLYLPRIESGSAVQAGGESGAQVGAKIIYKIGRDSDGDGICGLLWGEPGWDEVQDGSGDGDVRPLWPFPNEDVIKADMAAFHMAAGEAFSGSPEMIGARGFATGTSIDGSPQTLTKYIWEYLGNQIPAEIYGDVTSIPSNLLPTASVTVNSTSGTAPLLVNFNGTGNDADGQIMSYYWQFGDGQTSSLEDPSHTYPIGGNYTASLTVTDNDGASSSPVTVSITVTFVSAGNECFVDSLNGDDSAIGTQELPWKTIQHAIDKVGEGTIYVVNAGTPYAPIKFVGKSNIEIKGLNGVPEIRGTQYDDGKQVSIVITTSSNITLDSLDINPNASSATRDNFGVRMFGGVDHITIKNSELRNGGERNIMTASNSNYLTLENNKIHDAKGGHGVYFSNGGHDYVVRGNEFYNCNSTGMQFNGDGQYMYNILVERNTFSENAYGVSTVGSDMAAETLAFAQVHDAVIKNNVFFNNANKGVDVYSDSSPSYNVKIFNNTFFVYSDTGRPAIQVKADSSYDVYVTNNLVVNQTVENVDATTNMILNGNEENLFVLANPVCANDLMLKVGSLAIDQGVNLASENVIFDFMVQHRPQGIGYDVGAYEFVTSVIILPPPVDVISPAPPTGLGFSK